jgi:hypothetical protein
MNYKPCRSCRRVVQLATAAKSGKRIPLDVEPHDELGNILVDGHGRAHVFANAEKAEAARDEHPELEMSDRYVSHYATSPACRPVAVPAGAAAAVAPRPSTPTNAEKQEALPF